MAAKMASVKTSVWCRLNCKNGEGTALSSTYSLILGRALGVVARNRHREQSVRDKTKGNIYFCR